MVNQVDAEPVRRIDQGRSSDQSCDRGRTLGRDGFLPARQCVDTPLRAEFYWDDEAENWHYRVPALHINGGGTPSREDAERDCIEAISFVLEGDPSDYDHDAVAITLNVSVAPAA